MGSDETARLDAHIPVRLKEKLRQAEETQTDAVIEALEIYFGEGTAGSREAIERQIQRLTEQKAKAEQRKQTAEEQIREAEEGIARLRNRLDAMEHTAESYEDALDEQLAYMEENTTSVFVGHASAKRIARDHDRSEEEVVEDLRERSDLHPTYFTEGRPEPGTAHQDSLPWRGEKA